MEKFKTLEAKVAPLALQDVDTDQIYPAQYLTSVSREGHGQYLFRGMRDKDPQFMLNRPEFADAGILVVDSNFGCGSSREHAVWSIVDAGFRVVISKSFADIFSSNSAKNGLLLVVLPPAAVDAMLEDSKGGSYSVRVDLERQTVTLPGGETLSFEYDSFRKHCMLEGLDDIDYIFSRRAEVDAYRERTADVRFASTATIGAR